jgi:alpha-tubulin suppressor-like RCC1 family protein
VWCWGDNTYGQLGDGTTTQRTSPVQVGAATTWVAVRTGSAHSCGVRRDGTVWCWGDNTYGQLGDGTTTQRTSPVQIASTGNAATVIATGFGSTCRIDPDGTARCWGRDSYAELGVGTPDEYDSPHQVGAGTTWTTIGVGTTTGCAYRSSDGSDWCWGYNASGQVGDGTTTDRDSPVQTNVAQTFVDVAVGTTHACAVRQSQKVRCWGDNTYGQVGDGTNTNRSSPVLISGNSNYGQVSAGAGSTCGVQTNNSLWCWGLDSSGQLGIGSTANQTAETQVGSATNWAMVAVGFDSACAIKSTGTLWCWGDNSYGQLGDGSTTQRTAPVQIGVATTWAAVSAPGDHTCATRTDGTLWCWGTNARGQVGDGTTTQRLAPVQVGALTTWAQNAWTLATSRSTSCAIRTNSTLWCWGSNTTGGVGDGTTTDRSAPVQVGAATDWTDVVGQSGATMCGLRGTGSLWCWGAAYVGVAGDGVTRHQSSAQAVTGGAVWHL